MPGLEKRKAQFFVLEQKGRKCCDQRKTKNAAIFCWTKNNYGVLQGPRDKFRLVGSPLHSPASCHLLGAHPVQIARGLSDCRWNGSRIIVTGNQKHQQHHRDASEQWWPRGANAVFSYHQGSGRRKSGGCEVALEQTKFTVNTAHSAYNGKVLPNWKPNSPENHASQLLKFKHCDSGYILSARYWAISWVRLILGDISWNVKPKIKIKIKLQNLNPKIQNPNHKIQDPETKTKLQNPKPRIRPPKSLPKNETAPRNLFCSLVLLNPLR